ncbi:MAG: 3-oxoacyl-ACP reductase FabG [Clostridia bacterium]|nr:3-oxoacyl-ACP reductase FabG [Clostridia bacterium]
MKTAIVTGASGGIGLAITKKLISNGYFVIAQYNKNESSLQRLKKELTEKELGEYLFSVKCDFNNKKEVQNFVSVIEKSFKFYDVVVNNAGISLYKLINETTEDEWDNIFNVNVKSAYITTNAVLGKMIEKKSGNIINISSIWGEVGGSLEVAYSATKSSLIGYTKALAKEVGLSGIRVNCICPGVINTAMNQRFSKEETEEIISSTPLNRLGSPTDIANLVEFLCSEKSSFITGQIITVDGGFTL